MEKEIYLSYCSKDIQIVNKIDNYFKSRSIMFKRDKRDVKSWESIKSFMNKFGKSSCSVLIISDSYLKSTYCMYEVLEIMKQKNYSEKIITVVLNDASIYEAINIASYIEYWKDKYEDLDKKINKIGNNESTIDLIKELEVIKDIKDNINRFIAMVADRKNPEISNVCEEIKKQLIRRGFIVGEEIDGLEEFLNELDKCSAIKISLYPEDPEGEKEYKIQSCNASKGIHGVSINFDLNRIEDNEGISLSIIDIIRIEKNQIQSERHKKFYMWCKDRIKENEYNRYMAMKNQGIVNDIDIELKLLKEREYGHRCTMFYY